MDHHSFISGGRLGQGWPGGGGGGGGGGVGMASSPDCFVFCLVINLFYRGGVGQICF